MLDPFVDESAMSSHPNRSKATRYAKANPTAAEILTARRTAGQTMEQAAAEIYATLRTWQNWEAGGEGNEARRMHPGLFELYLLKTGQIKLAEAKVGSWRKELEPTALNGMREEMLRQLVERGGADQEREYDNAWRQAIKNVGDPLPCPACFLEGEIGRLSPVSEEAGIGVVRCKRCRATFEFESPASL